MGLFGFLGKAIGGIAKAVGGVAKVAAPFLPGPIGSVARIAGSVLQVKHGASPKIVTGGHPTVMRGRGAVRPSYTPFRTTNGYRPPPNILRSSPVMPGGAVAAPSGIAPQAGTPPIAYGGGTAPLLLRQQAAGWAINRTRGGGAKKRKKSSGSSIKRRRSKGGRRLKFGSPAWRKKYLTGRRRKRRAA